MKKRERISYHVLQIYVPSFMCQTMVFHNQWLLSVTTIKSIASGFLGPTQTMPFFCFREIPQNWRNTWICNCGCFSSPPLKWVPFNDPDVLCVRQVQLLNRPPSISARPAAAPRPVPRRQAPSRVLEPKHPYELRKKTLRYFPWNTGCSKKGCFFF